MGFASLGSGSRGNGTVVALADKVFLIDCGFNLKQTEKRLARLGLSGGDLDAVLVTHEHADHIGGVEALCHKYSVPVYASFGTLKYDLGGVRSHAFDGDVPFEIDGVSVNPVCVPHDSREPTQFVLGDGTETIGVLSDLGCVTAHVLEQYSQCSLLLMEANHDRRMLAEGSYPPRLKRRVGADYGHLSNDQALSLLQEIAHPELKVVLGHVSEQNNHPNVLARTFDGMQSAVNELRIANQNEGFDWIGRRPLIRQISFGEVL